MRWSSTSSAPAQETSPFSGSKSQAIRSHVTPIWSASLYWAFDWITPSKFFKMLQTSTWTAKAQWWRNLGKCRKKTNGVLVWRWMNVVGQTAQFKNHYTISGCKITCYSSPICLSLLSFWLNTPSNFFERFQTSHELPKHNGEEIWANAGKVQFGFSVEMNGCSSSKCPIQESLCYPGRRLYDPKFPLNSKESHVTPILSESLESAFDWTHHPDSSKCLKTWTWTGKAEWWKILGKCG